MPTAHISSPACLSATTTSAPSIPLACSWNSFHSLSRKGETASRFRARFFFFFFATSLGAQLAFETFDIVADPFHGGGQRLTGDAKLLGPTMRGGGIAQIDVAAVGFDEADFHSRGLLRAINDS